MKSFIWTSLFLFVLQTMFVDSCLGQNVVLKDKPSIDFDALDNWTSIGYFAAISDDGKYFSYNTYKGIRSNNSTLILQSTDNKWQRIFNNVFKGVFSPDNKYFVYQSKDTLQFAGLANHISKFISNVKTVEYNLGINGRWLVYTIEDNSNLLVIYDLLKSQKREFKNVVGYDINDDRTVLLIRCKDPNESQIRLFYINIEQLKEVNILTYNPTNNFSGCVFSKYKEQLVVQLEQKTASGKNDKWFYYDSSLQCAKQLFDEGSLNNSVGLFENVDISFSNSGDFLFINKTIKDSLHNNPDLVSLDVWNHKDKVMQNRQLAFHSPEKISYALNINNDSLTKLTGKYETIIAYSGTTENYVVVKVDSSGDRFWQGEMSNSFQGGYWLVSLNTGFRKRLPVTGVMEFWFSPNNHYLIFFGLSTNYQYLSYDLRTGKLADISKNIPDASLAVLHSHPEDLPKDKLFAAVGIGGWLDNGHDLIVYDNFDVWILDITGKAPPKNITERYGARTNTKLRLVDGVNRNPEPIIFKKDDRPLIVGFNVSSKDNTFFRVDFTQKRNLELLIGGPFHYYLNAPNIFTYNAEAFGILGIKPLKAKCSDVWLLRRESSTDAPNYFITKDFKHLARLTNNQPQKNYNWLTTQLVYWKQKDGLATQGILYKPENFNPNKQYPVIINYYEYLTQRLNQYPIPRATAHNINIGWFTSNGYIVLTPDIRFKYMKTNESAYNCIAAAGEWLKSLPYVDSNAIGINGHSVGGGLTNYILTRTNMFAAALEGAGVSDKISSSLVPAVGIDELDRLAMNEQDFGFKTIWDSLELYLSNSAVLHADKINTPLLMFHCKNDGAVPWIQAVELFTALYRLEKTVFLLQYDKGGHVVSGKDSRDFTIRINQFFDHYLKHLPAPRWMTRGIPAALKQKISGFELDPTGFCSKDCKVCKELHRAE